MRKLATIRKIDKLEPIEGADFIWKATIGGWELVTAKDNGFKEGDLVCYLEVDSWVPHEIAPFLSKGNEPRVYNGVKGERLKTIKLRGQISQGLILPVPDYIIKGAGILFEEGLDLTESLGIQKWEMEIPAQLSGQCRSNFPSFLRKTDQERCQNLKKEIFENNRDTRYEATVKMDGSSMTLYCKNEWDFGVPTPYLTESTVGVCSRNLDLKLDQEGNSFVDLAKNSGLLDALQKYCIDNYKSIALQGELCGPGIQGNKDGFTGNKFFLFDVYDIDKQRYMTPTERCDVYSALLVLCDSPSFNHAPVLNIGHTLEEIGITDIKGLLSFAEGKSYFGHTQSEREGVVFKSMDGNFSFKAISNKFLLKGGD